MSISDNDVYQDDHEEFNVTVAAGAVVDSSNENELNSFSSPPPFFASAPGDSFQNALSIDVENDYAGNDYVGIGDASDFYTFDVTSAGEFDFALTDLDAKAKLCLYQKIDVNGLVKYKKVKNATAKLNKLTGETMAAFGDVLLGVGTYYVEVASGDNGKGKFNTDYTLDITPDYFPAKSEDELDFKTGIGVAADIELVDNQALISGWVGFGDPQDVYCLNLDKPSGFSLQLDNLSSKAVVNIYEEDYSKGYLVYRRVKSVSAKYDKIQNETYAVINEIPLAAGTYYIEVLSGDQGKGKCNTGYDLLIESYNFPDASQDGFDFKTGEGTPTLVSFEYNSIVENGWVGFGDPQDVYKFTVDKPSEFFFDLGDLDKRTDLKIYREDNSKGYTTYQLVRMAFNYYDPQQEQHFTWSGFVPLDVGIYYIEVLSGDRGNGRNNSDYELWGNRTIFPDASVDEFDFKTGQGSPTDLVFTNNVAFVSEWVGFGDPQDVFSFSAAQAGEFYFDLLNLDERCVINVYQEEEKNGIKKYKRIAGKSTVYDPVEDTVSASLQNIMLDVGEYYVEILSGDRGAGKRNTDYYLEVFADIFPVATANNTWQQATNIDAEFVDNSAEITGYVGFGDIYDYYMFQSNSVAVYDFALQGDDKDAKLTIYKWDDAKNKLQKLANCSLQDGEAAINDLWLGTGDYYIEILASDKGKGKCNTDYTLDITLA